MARGARVEQPQDHLQVSGTNGSRVDRLQRWKQVPRVSAMPMPEEQPKPLSRLDLDGHGADMRKQSGGCNR
eukprot:10372556-Heterocapsa_arctica.AAC.1